VTTRKTATTRHICSTMTVTVRQAGYTGHIGANMAAAA
jgi:hypothetical protein